MRRCHAAEGLDGSAIPRRSALVLATAIMVAACGGATASQPSGSSAAFAAAITSAPTTSPVAAAPTPTYSPSPSQTPNPEAVRKTAADAYLAAAETANKAFKALNKKYKTIATLKVARAYQKAAAKIDGASRKDEADHLPQFPDDTKGDVHSMLAKWLEVQSLEIEASGVKSWGALLSVEKALLSAGRKSTAASNLVRSDLGLRPSIYDRPTLARTVGRGPQHSLVADVSMITRTYKGSTQAKAAQKMAADGAPPGHVMGGRSWAPGGRTCAASGFVLIGVLFLLVGFIAPPLWLVAIIFLIIGLVSGRGKGELTVTWVPESSLAPSPAPQSPSPGERTVEARLADLERLRSSGVLAEEGSAAKRATILSDI